MLSDDDWDPEDMDETPLTSPQTLQKSPTKTYLRILPPETINRKFDPHQNSQNSQNSDDSQSQKGKKGSENFETLENISTENSPYCLNSVVSKGSRFERSFEETSGDLSGISCPPTPKKMSNNSSVSFKTPEKSPGSSRVVFQRDRTIESPCSSSILRTPSKRSPSGFSPTKMSPTKRHYRPRKIFKDNTNVQTVVENLNLARQGAIPMNNFDLVEIYRLGEFKFQWGRMDTSAAENYDIRDVILPGTKHSERLFEMVYWVLSEPMNCGYFDEEERDMVFRMMSLRQEDQTMLAIMLKREIKWFRVKKLKYEKHFDGCMDDSLMTLADMGFFNSGE